MPKLVTDAPTTLRPYLSHLELSWSRGSSEALGDCPFCGREGKLSINTGSGLWRCLVCATGSDKGGGNSLTFLRELWKASDDATTDYDALAENRGLEVASLVNWGVVRSAATGRWLVPGWDARGRMCQLYQYTKLGGVLMATAGLGHGLFRAAGWEPAKGYVYLCEGPWDGMALEAALRGATHTGNGIAGTTHPDLNLAADVNVAAVPGCGAVGKPLAAWAPLFAGKVVCLCFDNDHTRPHPRTGKPVPGAGVAAAERATRILSGCTEPPEEILWLNWGLLRA